MSSEGLGFFNYYDAIQMNISFAQAMLRARRNGLEQFSLGTVKDYTPLVPTHFSAVAKHSECSSSAAMCVEETASISKRAR